MIDQFMTDERINGFSRVGVMSDMNVAFDATIQMTGSLMVLFTKIL